MRILLLGGTGAMGFHLAEILSKDGHKVFVTTRRNLISNLIKTSFMGCCLAFDRNLLNKSYPLPAFAIEHDTWIGICAYKSIGIKYINDKLIKYRRHDMNISACADNTQSSSLWFKVHRRLYMIYAYFKY